MALLDRIKFDGPPELLVWKYPKDNIVLGSQLIVNESQEAVFFKNGQALDVFAAGSHALSSSNIPLLQKILNIPFGGETPFAAEVFFVNRVSKLDYKWGTKSPFPVEDPKYNVLINIGAYGQYGMRINDSRAFVTGIVGTMPEWDGGKVAEYFKGLVITKVKNSIAKYLVAKSISVVGITAFLDELSHFVAEQCRDEFDRFGVELVNFFINSITIPDEEMQKIQKGQFQNLQISQLGDERYQRMRSLDVLETAAGNPGAPGTLLAGGMGLGIGAQLMGQAGGMAKAIDPSGAAAASTPHPAGPPCVKCGTVLSVGAKFCGQCGTTVSPALKCPNCAGENQMGAKFCLNCGKPLSPTKCPHCSADVPLGARFCASCGKQVGESI